MGPLQDPCQSSGRRGDPNFWIGFVSFLPLDPIFCSSIQFSGFPRLDCKIPKNSGAF